jgi:DNA invertase Pin-like site-specific DNA recombinase
MTTTRCAIYSRVSTNGHGQSCDMQIAELREFAARRGWQVVGEYVDAGVSGSKERRPELDRMMADCRKRRADVVAVYRYDRFARSLRHLVNALDEFNELKISFVSLHEGVDTTTPNGRLVFGIFASIAEFERELARGRILSGLALARARGVRFGRPPVDVDRQAVAELRASGASWRTISKRLGVSRATAMRAVPTLPKTAMA